MILTTKSFVVRDFVDFVFSLILLTEFWAFATAGITMRNEKCRCCFTASVSEYLHHTGFDSYNSILCNKCIKYDFTHK